MDITLKFMLHTQKLPIKGVYIELIADKNELSGLAAGHNLINVGYFKANYKAIPGKAQSIKLKGAIKANITQTCIATGKAVEKVVDKQVEITYLKHGSKLAMEVEDKLSNELYANNEDESHFFEIYDKNIINIGAITEEIFELSIDLYPRCDDAVLTVFSSNHNLIKEEEKSPFAILKKLK